MDISTIHRAKTGLFSSLSNQLTYEQDQLQQFIQAPFEKAAFSHQMDLKSASYSVENRTTLVEALTQQYTTVDAGEAVHNNLELLKKDTTFTITTGHQLSLFTGPLYFIYKTLHIIKLCRELKTTYPNNDFVPVFWMASEDHDFEEINHFHLFGKTHRWESDQKGPVGQFDADSLLAIREELHTFFQNHPESEIHSIIESYEGKTLGEAHFRLIHELFKNYGLIVIEPDCIALKRLFTPIIEKELFDRFAEEKVTTTTKALEQLGYKGQVFPRPINFFYIEKGIRERIQWENNQFSIDGKGNFSKDEIQKMLQEHPERFSPNVIFRPVYQEVILPNLCYVGGGGEMAYWLQLKGVFDDVNIPFPLIQVRNSLQLIDSVVSKKLAKLELNFTDFLTDIEQIKKEFVLKNSEDEVSFSALAQKVQELKTLLKEQISPIDSQLVSFTEIEGTKLDKQLEAIQSKVLRVQKQKMDTSMKQLEDVKNRLFPTGNLQERVDLFLNYCPDGNVSTFLESVYSAINPFEKDFIVVEL